MNDTMIKMAPTGALDQLGHAHSHIIHAFVGAENNKDVKIIMAKWDIKDRCLVDVL
jgi:hypothetical protein